AVAELQDVLVGTGAGDGRVVAAGAGGGRGTERDADVGGDGSRAAEEAHRRVGAGTPVDEVTRVGAAAKQVGGAVAAVAQDRGDHRGAGDGQVVGLEALNVVAGGVVVLAGELHVATVGAVEHAGAGEAVGGV